MAWLYNTNLEGACLEGVNNFNQTNYIGIPILEGCAENGVSQCNGSNWWEYYNSEGHNMEGCYLEGVDLSYANLSYANLEGADLSEAWLLRAELPFANLKGVDFYDAYTRKVDFSYADLSSTNLESTNSTLSDFIGTNLSYANLTSSALMGATFEGANLSYTNFTWSTFGDNNLCNITGSPSGDVCEESVTDNNWDGYDDVSYDAGEASVDTQSYYDAGAESGDVNLDDTTNIMDVVKLVNIILAP